LLVKKCVPYPTLSSILIYPGSFWSPDGEHLGNVRLEGKSLNAGESWHGGRVILSWADIEKGIKRINDGESVVLHEFAHQLDQEDGMSDGTPKLESQHDYRAWAEVLSREFIKLRTQVDRGKETFLDDYGATDEAEFFAVATESFFEQSKEFKRRTPKLYAEFARFYKLDPASW
jgi:MtfA peptidase